jgi:hypothetical protein
MHMPFKAPVSPHGSIRARVLVAQCSLALATLWLMVLVPSVNAQTLLACPDETDALVTYPPDYIREGQSWVTTVETSGRSVANAVLHVETAPTPIVLDNNGDGKLVMPPVASADREAVLVYEWDQDLGTQAACHGTDEYTVPIARAADTVGKASTGRLEGSYRARYTRGEGTATWRLSPTCDLLACNSRLRSSGGLRGTVKLRTNGTYSFTDDLGGIGECVVRNNLTGEVRTHRPAYVRHRLIVFRETDESGSIASTVIGDVTDTYRPTRTARADGCTGTTRHLKVTLTRK